MSSKRYDINRCHDWKMLRRCLTSDAMYISLPVLFYSITNLKMALSMQHRSIQCLLLRNSKEAYQNTLKRINKLKVTTVIVCFHVSNFIPYYLLKSVCSNEVSFTRPRNQSIRNDRCMLFTNELTYYRDATNDYKRNTKWFETSELSIVLSQK